MVYQLGGGGGGGGGCMMHLKKSIGLSTPWSTELFRLERHQLAERETCGKTEYRNCTV